MLRVGPTGRRVFPLDLPPPPLQGATYIVIQSEAARKRAEGSAAGSERDEVHVAGEAEMADLSSPRREAAEGASSTAASTAAGAESGGEKLQQQGGVGRTQQWSSAGGGGSELKKGLQQQEHASSFAALDEPPGG